MIRNADAQNAREEPVDKLQPASKRTTCRNGHPWVRENLYHNTGARADQCKTCRKEYQRKKYAKEKAEKERELAACRALDSE